MNTALGEITQHFIKSTLEKKNTSVLTLIFFNETIVQNKAYSLLSCAIYTTIKNMSVLII